VKRSETSSAWADVIPFLLLHRQFLGKWGVWLALAGFLILEWLAHASAAVVERLGAAMLGLIGWHPQPGLAEAAVELILPSLVFLGVVRGLGKYIQRYKAGIPNTAISAVFAHRGLIASVSLFGVRSGNPGPPDPQASGRMREEIRTAAMSTAGSGPNHREHLLRLLYQTTWGPLAAAVELHSERLRHVWLLSTKEVEADRQLIESWIAFLTGGRASVEPVAILDNNSVTEVRLRVHSIYETQVKLAGHAENQVIADITSGTAAMTAGIILATLDERRHVEYLSQGPKSLLEGGRPRADLASAFQYVHTSPNDVARAFVSFLEEKTGAVEDH
jgi:hypothetical protein